MAAQQPLSASPEAERTESQTLAGASTRSTAQTDAAPKIETSNANWAGTDNAVPTGRTSFAAAPGRRSNTADSRRSQDRGASMTLKRRMTELFTPEKPVGKNPTFMRSVMNFVKSNWLHIGWAFIPVSWALHFTKAASDTIIFIMAFLAIIPLAADLGYATEELSYRTGQTIGGLLNATLGNAVELIVAILALIKCELQVVQSSLIGSILSNILLVLGCCFFAGGVRFSEQVMMSAPAQLSSSLLLVAVIAVVIPSAFHFAVNSGTGGQETLTDAVEANDLLAMSHGVGVILLVSYVAFLIFQLGTHATLFADNDGPTLSEQYPENVRNAPHRLAQKVKFRGKKEGDADSDRSAESPIGNVSHAIAHVHGTSTALERNPKTEEAYLRAGGASLENGGLERGKGEDEDEEHEPEMNLIVTLLVMVVVTVIVGVTAEFLVSAIDGLTSAHPELSKEWVGLILLPIVGNAAEHTTAVLASAKDKIDLAISVAIGSSVQIALFVIPLIQVLAWILGKPMIMLFDPFEVIVVFLATLLVFQTLSDGRSNWMEGWLLMMVYLLIAVSFWYYPGSNTADIAAVALGQSCS